MVVCSCRTAVRLQCGTVGLVAAMLVDQGTRLALGMEGMHISFVVTRALLIGNSGMSRKVVSDHCSSRRRSDQHCANSQLFNAVVNTLRGAQIEEETGDH